MTMSHLRNGLLLCLCFLTAESNAAAQTPSCTPPPSNMVAWWPGDGNANDIVGANNGTLVGGVTFAPGEVAQAFSLDGVTSSVVVPDAPSLDVTQQLTVDAWVYPTAISGSNDVLGVIVSKDLVGNQYDIGRRNADSCAPSSGIPTGNIAFAMDGITGLPNECRGWVDGGAALPLGAWSHIALTFDGHFVTVYVNGAVTRQIAVSGTLTVSTGPLTIGGRSGSDNFGRSRFAGEIDEVEIFNRALSASEIQAVFNAGAAGKCKPGLTAPTNLQATQMFGPNPFDSIDHGIRLKWNYGADQIDGFIIESKSLLSTNWLPSQIALASNACNPPTTSAPEDCTYNDTSVTDFSTMSYRIRAYIGSTPPSYPSNEATAFQLKLTNAPLYKIAAEFTPESTLPLKTVAGLLGYDHFNWIQVLNYDPPCYQNTPLDQLQAYDDSVILSGTATPNRGAIQHAPHFDPPPGGYVNYGFYPGDDGPSDALPFIFDEQQQWYLSPGYQLNPMANIYNASHGGDQATMDTSKFFDYPTLPCLPGDNTQNWGFFTSLVGVSTQLGGVQLSAPPWYLTNYTPVASFGWYTGYNGRAGTINGVSTLSFGLPVIPGTGGVFNVSSVDVQQLPQNIRQLLIQSGAQNVSAAPKIDKDSPMTAAFLSGPQGTNNWYIGPVTVTLIATDVDGPSDVASTTYSLDGGPVISYTGPFMVSGNGAHIIQFGSTDRSGNVETPRPSQTITITTAQVTLTVSRTSLNYGYTGSIITSPQITAVGFTGSSGFSWSASSSQPNITISPASGVGNGTFQVTATFGPSGVITVTAPGAANSPQQIQVKVSSVAPALPYGSFDTPANNTTGIAGAIPVTGWALDIVEITSVGIYREPVGNESTPSNDLVYIGNATFVAGARPDVQVTYPNAPLNYRAGWGYMLLTNELPNTGGASGLGNGTYKLHAIATNKAGMTLDLGTRTITVSNAQASKPFGTIDTPDQGGTASGNAFVNFGWALTQNPHMIPTDGSTITVILDGVAVGHPTYNEYRSDIANLFPGLANSNGAIGFFYIDTTTLANGVHTISWNVFDNAGRGDGIGSRYFTVANTGTVAAPAVIDDPVATFTDDSVTARVGFRQPDALPRASDGAYVVDMEELDRVELRVGASEGHLLVAGERRSLPIGSTLRGGVFYWQAGPGFLGEYELVFERPDGAPVRVRVVIRPKSYAPGKTAMRTTALNNEMPQSGML